MILDVNCFLYNYKYIINTDVNAFLFIGFDHYICFIKFMYVNMNGNNPKRSDFMFVQLSKITILRC